MLVSRGEESEERGVNCNPGTYISPPVLKCNVLVSQNGTAFLGRVPGVPIRTPNVRRLGNYTFSNAFPCFFNSRHEIVPVQAGHHRSPPPARPVCETKELLFFQCFLKVVEVPVAGPGTPPARPAAGPRGDRFGKGHSLKFS